jgi:hypothetical protein
VRLANENRKRLACKAVITMEIPAGHLHAA